MEVIDGRAYSFADIKLDVDLMQLEWWFDAWMDRLDEKLERGREWDTAS